MQNFVGLDGKSIPSKNDSKLKLTCKNLEQKIDIYARLS